MSDLPPPPTEGGLEWRHPTTADAAALAAHSARVHAAERLEFLPGASFFEWFLTQPGVDPAHDALVAEHDGEIVADTGTWLHAGDRGARCIVWAEASPGFERLKPFMLEWSEARARQRLSAVDPALPRVIRISVESHRRAHRSVIEAAGFADPREFVSMARSLELLPPAPPVPDGVEVVPWSDDLEESTRRASNEAFADHWGSLPMSPAEFSGFFKDNPNFRPDLSLLAVADGEVVSFSLCEVDEEDNADRETNDVYLERIGTVRSHRGMGIASHLVVRCMEAAAQTGTLDRAALDVDAMSHTGATAVYERLGFEAYARSLTFFKEV